MNIPIKNTDKNLKAHAAVLSACAIWGLMSPVGKSAMESGISGMAMVTFRAVGGALCFWLASLWTRSGHRVSRRDRCLLFAAAMLAIVFNQCCFTVGLSLTSPVDASIVTTLLPIVTLILAAVILKEPVSSLKIGGILSGATGALLLITAAQSGASGEGSLTGNLLCLTAQCSFALYLTLFKQLIQRHSVVTCMKWMFLFAALAILPFSYREMQTLPWAGLPARVWLETAFVVVGATFVAYLLMMYGQQRLRPTLVSMYNYVQPIVACLVSVAVGLGTFGSRQALAVVLIFGGVWIVTQSKSRAQQLNEKHNPTKPHTP
ncbi:MAG: DMT family transporter [Clostridium sp.]|nr:DMT family transporter [Clostridium sp.]